MIALASIFDIAKETVLSKVTIPMYFYNIIVPQLGDYYADYPVNFEGKPVVCCPLHDEETPSIRYYEDTNSFFCFGCQTGGNVINLHMKYASRMNGSNVSYREAVFFLYDFFITGHRINKEQTVVHTVEQTKLNSEQDIIKLNLYRVNLERALSFDKDISNDIKKQLWEIFDKTDMLLSLNLVYAADVKKYIQKKVKELVR